MLVVFCIELKILSISHLYLAQKCDRNPFAPLIHQVGLTFLNKVLFLNVSLYVPASWKSEQLDLLNTAISTSNQHFESNLLSFYQSVNWSIKVHRWDRNFFPETVPINYFLIRIRLLTSASVGPMFGTRLEGWQTISGRLWLVKGDGQGKWPIGFLLLDIYPKFTECG